MKARTVTDYKEAVLFYLSDWLDKPLYSINKWMVEKKYYQIRDKGINGGIPTYSQATKVMRILSALMHYARADEIIESNPVEVLKLKRVDRSIRRRENYLPADKVRELLRINGPFRTVCCRYFCELPPRSSPRFPYPIMGHLHPFMEAGFGVEPNKTES